MIVERTKVLAAYRRAIFLGSTSESACDVVAQALGLQVESVQEVVAAGVFYCCPRGERQGVEVCPECAAESAAYSAAMGPVREGEPA